MPGSFSNKKVARAARTGGGRRWGGSSDFTWYLIVFVIVIVGASLVVVSRNDRLNATTQGTVHPLAPVAGKTEGAGIPGDNWFEAYGIYVCDKFVPNIDNSNNPYGISTSNDGVIHISPFEKKYAGHNANFGLFAKAVGIKVTHTSLQYPGDSKKYDANSKCGSKDGEFVVKEWSDASKDGTGKITGVNPTSLLLKNNAALTLAFVPKGDKNIPLPPSAANLGKIAAAATAASNGGTPATPSAPAGATTVPSTGAPAATATTEVKK